MTLPGHHATDEEDQRRIARLMQLHLETHPKRIAQKVGLSAKHIRRLWSKFETSEMAPVQEALALLKESR